MGTQTIPKMSLVAQFDDLCRYTAILCNGSEAEFKLFVENQLQLKRKAGELQDQIEELKKKITSLESEKKRFEYQMRNLKSLFEAEVNKRKKVELEKRSMEKQIAIIKEVLLADNRMDDQTRERLAQLSATCKASSPSRLNTIEESVGSLLSASDIDDTDEDITANGTTYRTRGKRKSSEKRTSLKKTKHLDDDDDFLSSDLPEVEIKQHFRKDQSLSEPTPSESGAFPITKNHRSDSDEFKVNTFDHKRYSTRNFSGGTPVGRYSSGGKLSRTHLFVTKTVIRAEKCNPCGRLIKFCKQALKCQDCRVICHPECKEQCPVPCVPIISTPTKGVPGSISDYTSSISPMIPSLIVHCVMEIESRGLTDIGLYRISAGERDVKELKEKFLRGRTVPSLNKVDVHTLSGTVKEFLRSLKEPLVPQSLWQAFVDAAEVPDYTTSINALYECVMELPQPNRDTLAFLILHWQRVANAKECKMPIENLAKVLGPTVVGYSAANPAEMNMISETQHQYKVMQRLLSIPPDSWQNMLNVEPDVFFTPIKSPETIPEPPVTRLGPIYSPGQRQLSGGILKTPRITRNSERTKSERKFFSSPLLK